MNSDLWLTDTIWNVFGDPSPIDCFSPDNCSTMIFFGNTFRKSRHRLNFSRDVISFKIIINPQIHWAYQSPKPRRVNRRHVSEPRLSQRLAVYQKSIKYITHIYLSYIRICTLPKLSSVQHDTIKWITFSLMSKLGRQPYKLRSHGVRYNLMICFITWVSLGKLHMWLVWGKK